MKLHNSADIRPSLINALISVEEACSLIEGGAALALSGPELALDQLPEGLWIGGTTPYFMTEEGGVIHRAGHVLATDLSVLGKVSMKVYGPDELAGISADAPENGFALAIMPGMSACHETFAVEAPQYPDAFLKPTIGWISGWDLDDPSGKAFTYAGGGTAKHSNRAVVLHVELPEDKMASVSIVNLFKAGNGDVVRFQETSFSPESCVVNGVVMNFADYIAKAGYGDCTLPMVGDFGGASVNVAIKEIDASARRVSLYAPVFPGVDYKFAEPVGDYAACFREQTDRLSDREFVFSCNCILNFLYGKLEGQSVGGTAGPVTFGEIAYQLLTQTMVNLEIN